MWRLALLLLEIFHTVSLGKEILAQQPVFFRLDPFQAHPWLGRCYKLLTKATRSSYRARDYSSDTTWIGMGAGRAKLLQESGHLPTAHRGGRPVDCASLMKKLIPIALVTLVLITISGITRQIKAQGTEPFSLPTFTDVTAKVGIQFQHQASRTSQKYLIETMGAGVAWLDYDGDGWLDLFFVNGAALEDPQPEGKLPDKSDARYWNRLYRNNGGETFEDVTEDSGLRGEGYGMGVAVGDYDNDGRPDLYVTNFGMNLLYHNEGNGTFKDVTEHAGVDASAWSVGTTFLDYDRDGHLDLIVVRYLDWDFTNNPWCGPHRVKERGYCHPNAFQSVTHLLYQNQGDGTFRDVSTSAGIAAHPGKGLGVAVNDYDLDGWPDILIANDSVAQQLFYNNTDGTFTERALEEGVAYNSDGRAFAGMGVDFNDYNNDGWPDVFVNALSLEGYVLIRNSKGQLEDTSDQAGISRISKPYSGWGTKFMDYDNDGWKDLFVAQGHVMDTISIDFPQISYKQRLIMMRNQGGGFQDVSESAGSAFRLPRAGRGAAFGDFNNDGFMDVAVNQNDGPPLLLRNGGNKASWILIQTVGVASNRDGIGALIRIVGESGLEQFSVVSTASSYLSASDKRVHFGLGSERSIKELEIRWPSRAVQHLKGVDTNQLLTVEEPARE